jgi:hypothetical protein
MTDTQKDPGRPDDRRTKITLAAITGLIAGATRAAVDWLITRFTTGS